MRREAGMVGPVRRASRRRPWRALRLALPCALAVACTPVELKVAPATAAERLPSPAFTVEDSQSPAAPRYDAIVVLDLGRPCAPQAGCPVVWRAELAARRAPARFAYGGADGFRDVTAPVPLRVGGEYQLLISGGGGFGTVLAEGKLRFRVTADGVVVAAP